MTANRSRIQLLRVLATRFKGNAPENLVATLEKFAAELEARKVDGRTFGEEDKRIERQRTLFAMLPSAGATDRLKEAMLQRAYDLMWDGDGMACDALAEFLPSADVERMFAAWESDWCGDDLPKSKFHGP